MKNLLTLLKDKGGKPEKIKQEKGLRLLYSLSNGGDSKNLASQSHFFIGTVMGLAIDKTILMRKKVAIGFYELFL